MSQSLSAYGTLLKIGDGGTPEVFATIAEVRDISGPSLSLATEETTTHSSAPASWRDHMATLHDAGEVTFDVSFVPTHATHNPTTGLLKAFADRRRTNFQMVFPDVAATTWRFAAFVTGFEVGAPVEGILTASVTLKVVGQPTLA